MNNNSFNNFANQDFSSLSNWLNNLNAYEFAVTGIITALLIAPSLTANQQNSIGNFLEEVGQVLLVIAAQEITVQQAKQNNTASQGENDASNTSSMSYSKEIENLKREIANLKKIINENS